MNATKELAREILSRWPTYEWTIQGLGMLRTYLAGNLYRLHIWDSRYRVDGVTMLHDHPWDFDSLVIAGEVLNRRYVETRPSWGGRFMKQPIVCGSGGGACDPPVPVNLVEHRNDVLQEGDTYRQRADEIHESLPLDGSVTLIERTFHENTEVAHVYYPESGEWVSAEPRPATLAEVKEIVEYSLGRWFQR